MSTYQYYEFMALDGPISDEGLHYAEGCSSRAEVSRYRWKNEYHWGGFSGREDLLLQYYDAYFYFADWGSFRFVLAFPEECLSLEAIEPYLRNGDEFGSSLTCARQAGRVMLRWDFQEEAVCWDDPVDISGMLGRLSGIRESIMRGDYRALFIGWLAGFYPDEEYGSKEMVPPIPDGMEKLSGDLSCLAGHMQLADDAVQAAVKFSPGGGMPEPMPMSDVVGALSVEEMKRLLIRVGEGEEGRVKTELIKRTVPQVVSDASQEISCRMFAEQMLEAERLRKEKELKKAEEKKQAEERLRREHLSRVFAESESRWKQLDRLLEKKTAAVYDSAAWKVEELRDAYAQADECEKFAERLSLFRTRYGNRPALMRRINEISNMV